MKSNLFLEKANKLVEGERNKDYGDKVINHMNIAKLWSAYTGTDIDMAAYCAIAGEIKSRET